MPLRWEMFINIYDRDSKHLAFVREFASVVSILQVISQSTHQLIEFPEFDLRCSSPFFFAGRTKQTL